MKIPILIYRPKEDKNEVACVPDKGKKGKSKKSKLRYLYDSHMGVYCICCKSANSVYIGQSTNVPSRLKHHKLTLKRGGYANNTKGLQQMQSDFKNYGEHDFSFVQIAECDKEDLFSTETEALMMYKEEGYNIYNYFINTHMSGLICPQEFRDVVHRVINLLDKGKLSLSEFEQALDRIENPW